MHTYCLHIIHAHILSLIHAHTVYTYMHTYCLHIVHAHIHAHILSAHSICALSTAHCQPLSPSPTPHDGGVGAAMADMLSYNSKLTELDVSHCGLTPQSCVSMFIALKQNSSLKKLYISWTTFDQAASEALADMLSCNQSLTELDIRGCDCHPKH